MSIGERIAQIRGKISREEFATGLNIHAQTLYLYEKGKRHPDVATVNSLCEKFNISADWLICERGSMRPGEAGNQKPEPPMGAPATQTVYSRGEALENTSTKDILERMTEAVGAKTDAALAQALGLSPQSISDARRKNKVPPAWSIIIAEQCKVSLDWIMFGHELTPQSNKADLLEAKVTWLEAKVTLLEGENSMLKEMSMAKDEALNAYKEILKLTRAENAELRARLSLCTELADESAQASTA